MTPRRLFTTFITRVLKFPEPLFSNLTQFSNATIDINGIILLRINHPFAVSLDLYDIIIGISQL